MPLSKKLATLISFIALFTVALLLFSQSVNATPPTAGTDILNYLPILQRPADTPTPMPTSTTAPTATNIPPTSTPRPDPQNCVPAPANCSCGGNIYNCSDFTYQCQAQHCYDYCVAQGAGDVHRLDRDNDGVVCESLPFDGLLDFTGGMSVGVND